jgi:hypothetical protein
MAQALQAGRAIPQNALYFAAALVAAIVLTLVVAAGMLNPFGAQAPNRDSDQVNPAVMQGAREWERQRLAQSGYVDPVIRAAREWERQRIQLSGAFE